MSINQAHLIHDHSSGRSSTRLHAPPGGKSSMGSSFGWGDDNASDNRGIVKRNPNASSFDAPAPSTGFGDTGASSVKVHNAPGGNSSISFGGPEAAPSSYAAPQARARKGEFVDNRIGCGVENRNPAANRAAATGGVGFGDTGASSVKVHQAPGGRSSGNILNWQ